MIHSPFGQVLKAIRENEPRAISLGYDADRYKLIAFVLSATLSGLAGAVKAIVFQLASLTDVHWTMSGEVVLMTLLGGMGTIFGPVVGAFVIIALESYLAGFGEWVTVITGAIFVVCVLAFRRGIVGELAAWWAQGARLIRLLSAALCVAAGVASAQPPAWIVDGSCRDGQPHGRYELRTGDGELRVVGAFNHGRRTGSFIFWTASGIACRAHPLRRGSCATERSRPGTRRRHAARSRRASSSRSGGEAQRDGITRSWYPDGHRRAEYRYERGAQVASVGWTDAGTRLTERAARELAERDAAVADAYLRRARSAGPQSSAALRLTGVCRARTRPNPRIAL